MRVSPAAPFTVQLLEWSRARPLAAQVRRRVFIEEQGVPETLEWDEQDAIALHALALDVGGACLGTGRIALDQRIGVGRIGRMAVLVDFRRRGVGSALLEACLGHARVAGITSVHLHAQVPAAPFYARHGFKEVGVVFQETGIDHIRMRIMPTQAIRNR